MPGISVVIKAFPGWTLFSCQVFCLVFLFESALARRIDMYTHLLCSLTGRICPHECEKIQWSLLSFQHQDYLGWMLWRHSLQENLLTVISLKKVKLKHLRDYRKASFLQHGLVKWVCRDIILQMQNISNCLPGFRPWGPIVTYRDLFGTLWWKGR